MQSPIAFVSLQEFLDWEQGQTQRHELLHGRIIPFASTSFDHNHISDSVREALNRVLPSPCYAYGTDIIIETISKKGESAARGRRRYVLRRRCGPRPVLEASTDRRRSPFSVQFGQRVGRKAPRILEHVEY
jgi:hypothetical protein